MMPSTRSELEDIVSLLLDSPWNTCLSYKGERYDPSGTSDPGIDGTTCYYSTAGGDIDCDGSAADHAFRRF